MKRIDGTVLLNAQAKLSENASNVPASIAVLVLNAIRSMWKNVAFALWNAGAITANKIGGHYCAANLVGKSFPLWAVRCVGGGPFALRIVTWTA